MFSLLKNKIAGFVSKLTAKKDQDQPKADEQIQEKTDFEVKTQEAQIVPEQIIVNEQPTHLDEQKSQLHEQAQEKKQGILEQPQNDLGLIKVETAQPEKKREARKRESEFLKSQKKPTKHTIESTQDVKENGINEDEKIKQYEKKEREVKVEFKPEEIRYEKKDNKLKVEFKSEIVEAVNKPQKQDSAVEQTSKVEQKIQTKSQQTQKKNLIDKAIEVVVKKEQPPAFENVAQRDKKYQKEVEFKVKTPQVTDEDIQRLEKRATSQKRQTEIKIGVAKSIANIFTQKIELEKKDVEELLDELELSLIESDVGLEVSDKIKTLLKEKLVGMKVEKSKMKEQVNETIKQVIVQIMKPEQDNFDFIQKVNDAQKPVKILFVGPNGAGKTTTIAKVAKMLMDHKKTVCVGACDTFRAAAIEQLSEHAHRLGIDIIKSGYGSDPASVAFDAIKHAKAKNIDVVLIDSAGRQDTNTNLIDEMKKIVRIAQPDMKIYIGESIGGSALVEQIGVFHKAIGIDGAILTKLDCDAKGGTAISLTYSTNVPILFFGTGQNYEDLKKFDAKEIADAVFDTNTN